MFKATSDLLRDHGGLVFAGFLLYFFSVFGQSIFFGAYLPSIQNDLGLSKTAIGSLYAAATIASSIAIIYTGKGLDHIKLRNFVVLALFGMAAGCFVMANAYNMILLFIAFFLLRQFGQGLLVLSATTSVNRYLTKNRGKATATCALGSSLHIILFPLLALTLDNYIHWQQAWMLYGLFVIFVLIPGFWFYLRAHQLKTHAKWEQDVQAESEKAIEALGQHWTRKHVLSDWRFYGLISIMIIAPFIGTAIFFYQGDIAHGLNISPIEFAASFPFFTVTSVICAFIAGGIIDKHGEKPVLIAFPVLYTIGLLLITAREHLAIAILGMIFIGSANGSIMTTGGPLLARLYGTKHLGSIKALLFSTSILGSALSPFIFGFLMDRGIDVLTILFGTAFYTGVIWLLAFPICKDLKRPA